MARELTPCTLCPAVVWVALSTNDHRLTFDADPDPQGTYIPVTLPNGDKRMQGLTGSQLPAQQPAWRQHTLTCTASAEYRRQQAMTRRTCPGPTADGDDCRLPMDPWLVENGHRWHITCGPAWPGEIRSRLRRDAA